MKVKINRNLLIVFILPALLACSRIPENVQDVLNKSGRNKKELEKVIDHYGRSRDKQKRKAAFFLIGNMMDKYAVTYPQSAFFFNFFPKIDSFKKVEPCQDRIDDFIGDLYLKAQMNNDNKITQNKVYDRNAVSSEYLIENIDLAFKVWKEKPWASHLDFDEFCEWILPYRINTEPLQPWRKYMLEKLSWIEDSISNPSDPKEVCLKINEAIARDFQFSHKMGFLPMLGGIDAWNNRAGICEHRYQLITMAMRAVGLPVAIDYTPQFPRKTGNHSWTVLLDADGKTKSFNGGEKKIEIFYPNVCPIGEDEKVTTVRRFYYAENENSLLSAHKVADVPYTFRDSYTGEVTFEYEGLRNTDITLDINQGQEGSIIYLFSFDYGTQLNAVSYTKIESGKATFEKIGRDGIYMAGYYANNYIKLVSDPFILPDPEGEIIYIRPDWNKLTDVVLTRKFNVKWTMIPFVEGMIGATVEGSNNPEFIESKVIYKIDNKINSYKKINVTADDTYRYYRYKSSDSADIRIAEFNLFYKEGTGNEKQLNGRISGFISESGTCDDGQFENAFDNNIRTNFNAPVGSWVALDAGRKVTITSFAVLARNHLNIVEPGDSYELFCFQNGWRSLGKKTAENYYLNFSGVPEGAVLLLKNLTKGQEERIFRYTGGEQVWW